MSSGEVVFSSSIRCPSCGTLTSGYLQIQGGGRGRSVCPRCGSVVVQDVPAGAVRQIPPPGFVEPGQAHARASLRPWLYATPKEKPRLCPLEVLRAAYSPAKAFSRLYLCAGLKQALAMVVVFAVLSNVAGVIVTESMAEVIGYSMTDALGAVLEGAAGVVVTLLSLLVFAVVASLSARAVFNGRGDRGSTITLVSYCYPWFVLVTVLLLAVFATGFEGLSLGRVDRWTDAEIERAIVYGAVLLALFVASLVWLLWVVSKAIGVANDTSAGASALCAVIAAATAGVVAVVAGTFIRLPIGLNF